MFFLFLKHIVNGPLDGKIEYKIYEGTINQQFCTLCRKAFLFQWSPSSLKHQSEVPLHRLRWPRRLAHATVTEHGGISKTSSDKLIVILSKLIHSGPVINQIEICNGLIALINILLLLLLYLSTVSVEGNTVASFPNRRGRCETPFSASSSSDFLFLYVLLLYQLINYKVTFLSLYFHLSFFFSAHSSIALCSLLSLS